MKIVIVKILLNFFAKNRHEKKTRRNSSFVLGNSYNITHVYDPEMIDWPPEAGSPRASILMPLSVSKP